MNNLDAIANQARLELSARDAARERMLPLCREVIRCSGNAIRAIHRQDQRQAGELLESARGHLAAADKAVAAFSELGNTGAIRDAQKEFAEAHITLAIVTGKPLPSPAELKVDTAAYLNGLGEAAGELRRYMLDAMRRGDLSRGEELLTVMDDIYSLLMAMDFPDAITGGLRRTGDMVRGVLERTRADLTLAIQQKALETRLAGLQEAGFEPPAPPPGEPVTEAVAAPAKEEPELTGEEQAMYQTLSAWRSRKSTEESIPPYIIAHNSILKEIARLRPSVPRELMTIKGFGERRVNKYGKEIIALLGGEP